MKLAWDKTGERLYETGVDRVVLYKNRAKGSPWNGVSGITESPSGAEPTALYANNAKYVTLMSAEELGLTIEAYTYPKEFEVCDGSAELSEGVTIGQQDREHFGFSYRSLVGNDESGNNYGYKLHLVYDCLASPSEKNRSTVNDSPDVSPFSWEVSTTPVEVEVEGKNYKPSAMLTIDSTKIPAAKLKLIEDKLYGTASEQPTLPLPNEILELLK